MEWIGTMKEIVLTDDIIACYIQDDHCYKASIKYNREEVLVFLITESHDDEILNNMKSLFLKVYNALPAVFERACSYFEEDFSEESLDIIREYQHEPSLTKKDLTDNISLRIIRIEEEGSAECDYIYKGENYITRFIFQFISADDIRFRCSCTEEIEE